MNWGHGITAFLIVFIGFMSFMFYKTTQLPTQLVTDNYNEEEINYQSKIDGRALAIEENQQFSWTTSDDMVLLKYPSTGLSGTASFYRPSDESKDLNFELSSTDSISAFSMDKFISGNYQIQLNWTLDEKQYYQEGSIFIP